MRSPEDRNPEDRSPEDRKMVGRKMEDPRKEGLVFREWLPLEEILREIPPRLETHRKQKDFQRDLMLGLGSRALEQVLGLSRG